MRVIDAILRAAGVRKKASPPPSPVRKRGSSSGYDAAGAYDDLTSWAASSGLTPNYLIAQAIDVMRSRSRDAVRNNPILAGYVEGCVRAAVGSVGFRFAPRKMPPKRDAALDRILDAHGRAMRVQSRRENFTESQCLNRLEFEHYAARALLRDGEVMVWRLRGQDAKESGTGYTLRVIDPQMLTSYFTQITDHPHPGAPPDEHVVAGIGLDRRGRVRAFYMREGWQKSTYASLISYEASDIIRVPAEDVMLLFRNDWANQIRGVSPLNVVLKDVETLKRYAATVLLAARKNAAMSMAIQTPAAESKVGGYGATPDATTDAERAEHADPDTKPAYVNLGGMYIPVLGDGEVINHYANQFPGEIVAPYMDHIKRLISVGLSTTPVRTTNDYGDINFSAGMLMHSEEQEQQRMLQVMIGELHEWWHRDWVQYELERGMFRDEQGKRLMLTQRNLDIMQDMKIFGRVFSPVDKEKEAKAYRHLLETGVLSLRAVLNDMGRDPDEIFAQRKQEEEDGLWDLLQKPEPMEAESADSGGGGAAKGGKKPPAGGKKPAQKNMPRRLDFPEGSC